MNRTLIDKLIPPMVEQFDTSSGRQGYKSRAVREAVLGHDLVRADLEAAHRAYPRLGIPKMAGDYATERIGQELRKLDCYGFRLRVNIVLEREGAFYVPFRTLRLAEVLLVMQATEREKVQREVKLYRLGKFRSKLEGAPANTTVDDVYDNVVGELFGQAR